MELDILIDTPELPEAMEQEPLEGSGLTVEDVLGPGGLLAQHVAGYEYRPEQLRIALRPAALYREDAVLQVAQAQCL